MGLTIDYFYSLTPSQFTNISRGYVEKREIDIKLSWEQCRFNSFYAVVAHSKRIKRPEQIITFPWEKSETQVQKDNRTPEEQLIAVKEFWENIDKK